MKTEGEWKSPLEERIVAHNVLKRRGQRDPFADFVAHPRYGQHPRITGLNPAKDLPGGVHYHWRASQLSALTPGEAVIETSQLYDQLLGRIADTAIAADLSRQSPATIPVTHYFDHVCRCTDCGRLFLFFAAEQKYWYEDLGFPLESDCVRCVPCRKQRQGLDRQRELYETLFHVPHKSEEQLLQMAEANLSLIEAGLFHGRQTQRVRELLNRIAGSSSLQKEQIPALLGRVRAFEALAES